MRTNYKILRLLK